MHDKKATNRDMLRAGIRTAKRLNIRTAEGLYQAMARRPNECEADAWIACLLAEDIRRETRAAETLPAPPITE